MVFRVQDSALGGADRDTVLATGRIEILGIRAVFF